jgi:Flp pilus assembly protein TadD
MLGSLELVADRRAARSYQLLGTGAYTAAVASADGAALLRPDSIRYWFVAADVVSRPGSADDLAAAMLRVDRALLVSPGDPILLATRSGLLLDRAQVTGSSSDLGLALVALSELTASDRNNAGHRLSLGLALVLAGDLEGAEREWLISQDLAPGSPVPSINLTRLYLEQGRLAEAEASYRRALSIDSSAEGLVDLATLLNVAGVEVPLP